MLHGASHCKPVVSEDGTVQTAPDHRSELLQHSEHRHDGARRETGSARWMTCVVWVCEVDGGWFVLFVGFCFFGVMI